MVLNRFWQPVQTCSARRALKLLCLGHAQALQTEGEEKFRTHDFSSWAEYSESGAVKELVHSVSIVLGVPRIIVLSLYDKFPRLQVRLTRRNVFLRDQFTCQYCAKEFSEPELNLDHVMPRDKGGRMTWENIVTSCIRCNTRKANKLPKEANMHPLKKPVTPKWRPIFGLRGYNGSPDDSWRHFLEPDRTAVRMSA
ncbi:restriction endonuclease [Haloferula helveola]|uniref:Restriction endonuclease n=1 Tax=Haloferula helveola TaxID=490095 RepID=A0ABN6HDL0_9BACT|nr:restriction endonuclease [Haloferula helveola]